MKKIQQKGEKKAKWMTEIKPPMHTCVMAQQRKNRWFWKIFNGSKLFYLQLWKSVQVRDPLDQHQKIRHLSQLRQYFCKSAGKSSWAKPWRKAPKERKRKKWKEKNERKSVFFYTCRRSFQVQSCGPAMAPVMLLQRGGMLHGVWYFHLFPPSAVKVGVRGEKKPKEICIPHCFFLSKSLRGINAHLKKCSREYLMQTSESIVQPYKKDEGKKRRAKCG